MKIKPAPGIVICEPYEESSEKSTFMVAGNLAKRELAGKVIAVGDSIQKHEGTSTYYEPAPCKVGDIIIHRPYYAEPFRDWNTSKCYKFINFNEVVGVVEL